MFYWLSKHLEFHQNTLLHVTFSTLFLVFGYPDETLSLVFDILHQPVQKIYFPSYYKGWFTWYDRPTTWLGTIYMRTTFSLTKLNMQKFTPGFTEQKNSNKRKQIFWLSCTLKKLSNEMFFTLIRSVLYEKWLHVNLSTTTSSAILT